MTKSARFGRLLQLLSILFLLLPLHAAADTSAADGLIGNWMVDTNDAIIRIDGVGTGPSRRYVGHIAWLKDTHYLPEDGPALNGKPLMDINNPDAAQRSQPLLGLRLLWDLRYEDDHWIGGRVYDSDNGHTFDCTVQLKDADHLRLHAYVLHVTLFGGSTIWTRTNAPPANVTVPPTPPSAH